MKTDTKKTVLLITGGSLSGKSHLQDMLIAEGFCSKIISSTTRPKRNGEVEGESYFYMSKKEFLDKKSNGDLIEDVVFNGFHYGIEKKAIDFAFEKSDITSTVIDPHGAAIIRDYCASMENPPVVYQVFFDIPLDVILERFEERKAQDKQAIKEVYDARLAHILGVERKMIDDMGPIDLTIKKFDQENGLSVKEHIKQLVQENAGKDKTRKLTGCR